MSAFPREVTIFEVGARDGLQNEAQQVPVNTKAWFIDGLAKTGLREIEIGAFVRSDRVPQMADTDELYKMLREGRLLHKSKARAWSLIPNLKGLERAQEAGAKNLAVFIGVTDSFTRANVGKSVAEQLAEFKPMIAQARKAKLTVRGYLSTAFGCPFEGVVAAKKTLTVAGKLFDLGVQQVSIGDTIGVAVPRGKGGVDEVVKPALRKWGSKNIALHFHDTRGTALANALRALELGVKTLDSSAGGLGGCPFAPGATGNLATEDLVYMLHQMGVKTGVNLEALCQLSAEMAKRMGRPISSRYLMAWLKSCKTPSKS